MGSSWGLGQLLLLTLLLWISHLTVQSLFPCLEGTCLAGDYEVKSTCHIIDVR